MTNRWRRTACAVAVWIAITTGACQRADEPRVAPRPPVALPAIPTTGTHYAQTAWATVHRDSRSSDYAPLSPDANVAVEWTALEGATVLVGPVLGPEGNLYVPTGRGVGTSHLHAFRRDGTLLWEAAPMRDLSDFDYAAVVCAPIVDGDGHVYAADSNQLWSFDAQGRTRWVVDLPAHGVKGFFVTPIFTREGFVGGVSTNGQVAFFHREDGALAIPVIDLPGGPGPDSQEPAPGLWGGGLVAEAFIRELWDLTFGRAMEVANTPAVHPETGRIFLSAAGSTPTEGILYGIDTSMEAATIAFAAPMGKGSGTSPAISPDGRLVYAIDDEGFMVALDTGTGERIWDAADTMGQASPSVGPDGTVYSFNGIEGTIVAIDGRTGATKWRREYHEIARRYLWWAPFLPRVTTVDGIMTVTDNGLWAFLDLNYEIRGGERPYPQPRKVVLAQIDTATGDALAQIEVRDTSSAFVVPDVDGRMYLSLGAASSSIAYYGVNEKLPWPLRVRRKPVGGIVALAPIQE